MKLTNRIIQDLVTTHLSDFKLEDLVIDFHAVTHTAYKESTELFRTFYLCDLTYNYFSQWNNSQETVDCVYSVEFWQFKDKINSQAKPNEMEWNSQKSIIMVYHDWGKDVPIKRSESFEMLKVGS